MTYTLPHHVSSPVQPALSKFFRRVQDMSERHASFVSKSSRKYIFGIIVQKKIGSLPHKRRAFAGTISRWRRGSLASNRWKTKQTLSAASSFNVSTLATECAVSLLNFVGRIHITRTELYQTIIRYMARLKMMSFCLAEVTLECKLGSL